MDVDSSEMTFAEDDAEGGRAAETCREALRRAFAEASRDPLFLEDVADIEEAFRSADAETAAMIPCEECGED